MKKMVTSCPSCSSWLLKNVKRLLNDYLLLDCLISTGVYFCFRSSLLRIPPLRLSMNTNDPAAFQSTDHASIPANTYTLTLDYAEDGQDTGQYEQDTQMQPLLAAILVLRNGDFSCRLSVDSKTADAFNDVVAVSEQSEQEKTRSCRKEGKLKQQMSGAVAKGISGVWKELSESVKQMAGDLTQRTTTARALVLVRRVIHRHG